MVSAEVPIVSVDIDPARSLDDAGDEGAPALSEEIRHHLGRLIGSAYERPELEAEAAERFADLLAKLEVVLDRIDHRAAREFQADLLAMAPALRRFALSLTHDTAMADDLIQDTMLRAWRSQASFAVGSNLEAWVFTIMRNQFYSHRRKHGREVQDEDDLHAARLATLPEQGGHLDLQDLRSALDRLAPVMREALVLVTIENLTYDEAATVMGCQTGTVKSRVWRARDQLARMLGYTGGETSTDAFMSSAMTAPPTSAR